VQPDPVITAINRFRAARAEVDKIAIREPMLPDGHPADETEEYARWETANLKATDATATAWTEVAITQPTTVAGASIATLRYGASALLSLRTRKSVGHYEDYARFSGILPTSFSHYDKQVLAPSTDRAAGSDVQGIT
jgi:hypothetical protein